MTEFGLNIFGHTSGHQSLSAPSRFVRTRGLLRTSLGSGITPLIEQQSEGHLLSRKFLQIRPPQLRAGSDGDENDVARTTELGPIIPTQDSVAIANKAVLITSTHLGGFKSRL